MLPIKEPLKPTIYIGTFVSVPSLSSPLLIQHGALWVDKSGIIGGYEDEVGVDDYLKVGKLAEKLGWRDGEFRVVKCRTGMGGRGWVMPGFIGMSQLSELTYVWSPRTYCPSCFLPEPHFFTFCLLCFAALFGVILS
jgi:hypothetical protein